MKKIVRFFPLVFIVVFSVLQFASLKSPIPTDDEAEFADYAVHGHLSLWRSILPESQRIVERFYGFGLNPFLIQTLKFSLTKGSLNLFWLRAAPMAASLLSLIVLWLLIKKLKLPEDVNWVTIVCFGSSYLFFLCSHSARPEGFIFLFMLLNILWLFSDADRILGFGAGLLAGLGWGFHPAMVFLWISWLPLVYFRDGLSFFKSNRNLWWAVGGLIGLSLSLFSYDVENAIGYLHFEAGKHVVQPPLLEHGANVGQALLQTLDILKIKYRPAELGNRAMLGAMIFSLVFLCRYRKKLLYGEKASLMLAITFLVAYTLFTSSRTIQYSIYLIPWLTLCFFLCAKKLIDGTLSLDANDLRVFFFSILIIGTDYWNAYRAVILAAVAIRVLFIEGSWKKKSFVSVLVLLAFTAFSSLDPVIFFGMMKHLIIYRWPSIAFTLVLPWIVFPPKLLNWVKLTNNADRHMAKAMAGVFILIAGITFFQDIFYIKKTILDGRLTPEFTSFTQSISANDKVLAPGVLWFYTNTPQFQSVDPLLLARAYFPYSNPTSLVTGYKPRILLWPMSRLSLLTGDSDGKKIETFKVKREWITPWGPWAEITQI